MTTKYRNPPINEVIIGAYFDEPILSMRSEHVGLFWSGVRDRFPEIQQKPELALPISAPKLTLNLNPSSEPYPMPRFWLISGDETTLIQIQKNALILNWRKRSSSYPHFDNVKKYFDKYFNMFESFAKKEFSIDRIGFHICELSYHNLIEPCEYWRDSRDTGRVIQGFSIPSLNVHSEPPPDFNFLTVHQLAPDLSVNVAIRTARKQDEATRPVLVVEFRALGAVGSIGKGEADAWYDRAHELIGTTFNGITTADVQNEFWQPI